MKMNLGKLVVLGAVLAASAPFASATPISGAIATSGNSDTFTSTGYTFMHNPYIVATTGTLAPFSGVSATMVSSLTLASPDVTVVSYTNGLSGLNLSSFSFAITGPITVDANTASKLDIEGTGLFLETVNGVAFDATSGTFTLQEASNGIASFQFTAGASPVPEPNSLMLLGTGLVSAAGMLVRKRRIV